MPDLRANHLLRGEVSASPRSRTGRADTDPHRIGNCLDGHSSVVDRGHVHLGREIIFDGSDSHGADFKTNSEGLVVFLEGSGPYLVFYRIPSTASVQSYANLTGYFVYREITSREKNTMHTIESALNLTDSSKARPGGLYAWTVIMYDQSDHSVKLADLPSQLPPGISRLPP